MKPLLGYLLTFILLCEQPIHGLRSCEGIKSKNTNVLFIKCNYFYNKCRNRKNRATNFEGKTTALENERSSSGLLPIFLRKINHAGGSSIPQNLQRVFTKDYEREETEHSRNIENKAKDNAGEFDNEDVNEEVEEDADEDEIYYDLNHENVEKVLNLIRPKLQIDNGDVELVDIKDNILYIRLLGNCVSCSSNSVTVSEVIKKTLKKYIRDENKKEPNVIITNFDDVTEENIQKCLDQLKPYFDFIKIELLISNLIVNKDNINNSVLLKFQSTEKDQDKMNLPSNIRNEITERIKQKFPSLNVNFEN